MSIKPEFLKWRYTNFLENSNYRFDRNNILNILSKKDIDSAYKTISEWEGYQSTPLLSLNKLSEELKINKIFYKDESKRFDLKSFKALGGAYAVEKIAKEDKNIIISSATAGNHVRSVAWGSKKIGLKCNIFISEQVSEFRAEAMRNYGAEVIRVKGNYDDSLKDCFKQ